MKINGITAVVCWTCLTFCLVFLGLAVFWMFMGRAKQAIAGPAMVLLILRFNLWFLRRQRNKNQP